MKTIKMTALLAVFVVIMTGIVFCAGTEKPAADYSCKAEEALKLMSSGKFEDLTDMFDDSVKEMVSASMLRTAWEQLVFVYGSFKKVNEIKSNSDNSYSGRCEFAKGSVTVFLSFNEKGKLTAFLFKPLDETKPWQPPSYADSQAFTEKDIKFGTEEWELPGTLTIPAGKGKFPVVVLVHGSGPNDRDETVGANKVFKDLAWGLASRGIAVLRYEKRTRYYSIKMADIKDKLTLETETADDAVEAVRYLKTVPEINSSAIFVLGHSLGGTAIPLIARKDNGTAAGYIIMAGTVKPLEDLIVEQITYIFGLDGNLSISEKAEIEKYKKQAANVKDPNLNINTPSDNLPFGIPAGYWLYLRSYNPAAEAANIAKPVLCLQGGRDYQVTPDNLDLWKNAFKGKINMNFCLFPALNHLFIAGEGQPTPSEYSKPGHVDEKVIAEIAGWIKKQVE